MDANGRISGRVGHSAGDDKGERLAPERADAAREEVVIDFEQPPFRKDPRLGGIIYLEDPTVPLRPEDWLAAYE